jgi:Asp-tRNA(Asn)/Glu-tRNA(Gln) amidotransferase A subunit family amidase
MNRPWTTLGTPAIAMPLPLSAGLPLGLQLTADRGQDARLLAAAVRVARVLFGEGPLPRG